MAGTWRVASRRRRKKIIHSFNAICYRYVTCYINLCYINLNPETRHFSRHFTRCNHASIFSRVGATKGVLRPFSPCCWKTGLKTAGIIQTQNKQFHFLTSWLDVDDFDQTCVHQIRRWVRLTIRMVKRMSIVIWYGYFIMAGEAKPRRECGTSHFPQN